MCALKGQRAVESNESTFLVLLTTHNSWKNHINRKTSVGPVPSGILGRGLETGNFPVKVSLPDWQNITFYTAFGGQIHVGETPCI